MKKQLVVILLSMIGPAHAVTESQATGNGWLTYFFALYYLVLILYTLSKWVQWARAIPAGGATTRGFLDALSWTFIALLPLALFYAINQYLALVLQQL